MSETAMELSDSGEQKKPIATGPGSNDTSPSNPDVSRVLTSLNSSTSLSSVSDEKAPLVRSVFHLTRSLSGWDDTDPGADGREEKPLSRRSLSWLGGVFACVALGQLSSVVFLRVGFIVGQAGLIQSLIQFTLAYGILYLTILSICAISTNGAVEGGGAYFMISRALGPEFGGSIGFLFFLANIISCALYISGCVEGITDNFGPGGLIAENAIPGGSRWWTYLYATMVLALCLIICLIGGAMFARTSIFILCIVVFCTLTVVISFFVTKPTCIDYAHPSMSNLQPANKTHNVTEKHCGNFTGMSSATFESNIDADYTYDYSSEKYMNFAAVFAVLFSSVTGIMNGANMSGELKDPSKAIPRGTLTAPIFTYTTYIVLVFLTAATCDRELLVNNYIYMQKIDFWEPFVVIGIFMATLSAALGNLIGASRILEALASDQLFWNILKPATITSKGGNPYIAVIISWFLVQIVLLIGSLNAISPLASVFFLLAYASTNLACLGLDVASAPNFRPTFKYFSWHTSLLGLIGCIVMCFLIEAIYASIAITACMMMFIVLLMRTFPVSWGSISQAIIFHQVRKYLLMLDSRRDHIRFWRPQMLLLVSNPRGCCELIEFINDIKKSGLYVLGHVMVGNLDDYPYDPVANEFPLWLNLVDTIKVKAFVEVTLSSSVREGFHHLVRTSGLGGMKPNTICMGFYDSALPTDSIGNRVATKRKRAVRFYGAESSTEEEFHTKFPSLRNMNESKQIPLDDYVAMIADGLKLNKNVCLFRHFNTLDRESVMRSKTTFYVDVWPINFFDPDSANYFDTCCLFLLQLACVLNMVPAWKKHTQLRVFLCVDAEKDDTLKKERKLDQLLRQLRILGRIKIVTWQHVKDEFKLSADSATESETHGAAGSASGIPKPCPVHVADEFLNGVNELIKNHCSTTVCTFLYLPRPPRDSSGYARYLQQLDMITEDLPPTVLVHGVHPVTSTTL